MIVTSACAITLEVVLKVLDLRASPSPRERAILLLHAGQHTHAIVEHAARLREIEQVEAEGLTVVACLVRLYLEKEPLGVSISIGVVLKHQIVLIWVNLYGCSQVTRLKFGVEINRVFCVVLRQLRV